MNSLTLTLQDFAALRTLTHSRTQSTYDPEHQTCMGGWLDARDALMLLDTDACTNSNAIFQLEDPDYDRRYRL
jgi:hypothetical protein